MRTRARVGTSLSAGLVHAQRQASAACTVMIHIYLYVCLWTSARDGSRGTSYAGMCSIKVDVLVSQTSYVVISYLVILFYLDFSLFHHVRI